MRVAYDKPSLSVPKIIWRPYLDDIRKQGYHASGHITDLLRKYLRDRGIKFE